MRHPHRQDIVYRSLFVEQYNVKWTFSVIFFCRVLLFCLKD